MRVPNLTLIYDRKGQACKERLGVVELKISLGRERKYISTGIKLKPREWSNGSVVGRADWKELNDELQIVKRHCSDIIIGMMEDGSLDLAAIPRLLKDRVIQRTTFLDYSREVARIRCSKLSERTGKHYAQCLRYLEKWRGIVRFSDVTEENIMRLDDSLRKKGLKEVSRWCYHKIVKTFILRAMEDGLVKKNPYKRLDIKKGEGGLSKYLTPEEFHRLECVKLPSMSLERIRDLFVFQTYTMLSYQDLAAFRYEKCEQIEDCLVYKGRRKKNGQEFTIALTKPALAVLCKYRYRLPIISNVKYNQYLKVVAQAAGIDKPVTTHWARHTGATMLVNEGKVPMHIVQHVLGHASIRETERTYAKVLDTTIVRQMSGLF